jgi:hypothetical protein
VKLEPPRGLSHHGTCTLGAFKGYLRVWSCSAYWRASLQVDVVRIHALCKAGEL